ncbi:hypothetical protein HELRODRAFT_180882 [Helobdella robusta]|uniref:Uncharacterized protein n=1 Tax=Helobdella robusta TaxID=6412 RepID=T1FGD1_HELRO|nr:hypothetical protein HELRODRAFT_180882 [Helobdella robusta]ESN93563.1 hypothetical protein HELRODRAFT_180882 [Helobdella robusta]
MRDRAKTINTPNQPPQQRSKETGTPTTRDVGVGTWTMEQGTQTDEVPQMVDNQQQTDIAEQIPVQGKVRDAHTSPRRTPTLNSNHEGNEETSATTITLTKEKTPTHTRTLSTRTLGEIPCDNVDKCVTEGDSDDEEKELDSSKQATLYSYFQPTQEFIRDLNENELLPEGETSNYIPPTTRGASRKPIPTSSLGRKTKEGNNTIIFSCLKGVEELKKRINFSLDNDTKIVDGYLVHKNIIINPSPKEQNRQMSVEIVKHILPYLPFHTFVIYISQ